MRLFCMVAGLFLILATTLLSISFAIDNMMNIVLVLLVFGGGIGSAFCFAASRFPPMGDSGITNIRIGQIGDNYYGSNPPEEISEDEQNLLYLRIERELARRRVLQGRVQKEIERRAKLTTASGQQSLPVNKVRGDLVIEPSGEEYLIK